MPPSHPSSPHLFTATTTQSLSRRTPNLATPSPLLTYSVQNCSSSPPPLLVPSPNPTSNKNLLQPLMFLNPHPPVLPFCVPAPSISLSIAPLCLTHSVRISSLPPPFLLAPSPNLTSNKNLTSPPMLVYSHLPGLPFCAPGPSISLFIALPSPHSIHSLTPHFF